MKEERFPHTRKPRRHWQRRRGEASEPRRRAQQQGCRGQSGEIPAQRIGTDQHSPAREACLLTRQGRWGLGAEVRASVGRIAGRGLGLAARTQPEGVSAPQLAGRESGKRSGAAEQARDFFCLFVSWCARRGDSEHRIKELQRRARAVAISADPRDGRETLRLLLPPARSLCVSTGHSPHRPTGSLCSPPPGSRDPGTTSPVEHTARLRLLQRHAFLCRCRLALPPLYPYLPPA